MPMPMQLIKSQSHNKKKPLTKSKKAGLTLPVHHIWKRLKKGNYANKIHIAGGVYLAAVLEYLSAEVLELAGMSAKSFKRQRIIPRHIQLAVRNDQELHDLLSNVIISEGGVTPFIHKVLLPKKIFKSATLKQRE